MDRDLLVHLPVFVAVARRAGFAAAAGELGMSPSAVSHAIRQLEDRLGLPLFARTTRSVALTEAGQGLFDRVAPALQSISEGGEQVASARDHVGGLLRINAPSIAVRSTLAPIIADLAETHPDLRIEVRSDNGLADIVADGFDAGVRLGEMVAADMVAVRLTPPFRTAIVAAPAYLARQGRPSCIADLSDHSLIGFRMQTSGALYRWELQDGEREVAIDMVPRLIVNDALIARSFARDALGLAYLFEPLVRDDLAAGRLEEILPQTSVEETGSFLYFPRFAAQTPKLRVFIEAARARLARKTAASSQL